MNARPLGAVQWGTGLISARRLPVSRPRAGAQARLRALRAAGQMPRRQHAGCTGLRRSGRPGTPSPPGTCPSRIAAPQHCVRGSTLFWERGGGGCVHSLTLRPSPVCGCWLSTVWQTTGQLRGMWLQHGVYAAAATGQSTCSRPAMGVAAPTQPSGLGQWPVANMAAATRQRTCTRPASGGAAPALCQFACG